MPIIYLHGVNTRDPKHFEPVREYLRRIVAPAIAKDPSKVSIRSADWFSLCQPPKWEGSSRPLTALSGMGPTGDPVGERAQQADAILQKLPVLPAQPSSSRLTSGQSGSASATVRLASLPEKELADLITLAAPNPNADALTRARTGVAADAVARDPAVRSKLDAAKASDEELRIVADALQAEMAKQSTLAAAGVVDFYHGLKDRVSEGVSRIVNKPLVAASVVAGELRPGLNDFVTRFLGDVLFYMTLRGTRAVPGPIPLVLIKELEIAQKNKAMRDGEPIVLLTHSMGGQIAYDTVSAFLPSSPEHRNIKVDYWCATASQVGFFEELNMFLASSPNHSKATARKVPFPGGNLGHWWNVWDRNDILSFTAKDIFEGLTDEEYPTGKWIAAAHGGYLEQPSFYRAFAERLEAAFPGRT